MWLEIIDTKRLGIHVAMCKDSPWARLPWSVGVNGWLVTVSYSACSTKPTQMSKILPRFLSAKHW